VIVSETQRYTPAPPIAIAEAAVDVRFEYMKGMYGYLMGGIAAFVAFEIVLFTTGIGYALADIVFGLGGVGWLVILGGFSLLNWLATTYAFKAETQGARIAAYSATIVAQALIFTPMLAIAFSVPELQGSVGQAAAISTVGFIGLTGVALTSSKDFSFLGSMLKWVGIAALLLIVVSVFTGFNLGAWFSVAMIAFAGGAILWETQQILRNYPEGTELLAAIQLFASVMLLFWYVLRLVMSFGRD